MNNKPLLSALGAAVYIIGITRLVNYLSIMSSEDNWIVPITLLGLLVLSVAVMAYLFLHEPVRLYMDNKRSEAIGAFLKTVLFFGGFVLLSILVFLSKP